MARMRIPRLADMTEHQRQTYERVLHAVSLMRRHKVSISEAAHEAGTTPETVVRYGRPALIRAQGRWASQPRDRLERRMLMYDPSGSYHVAVRSSTTATRIGEYHNAVRRFVETGDDSKLRSFAGNYVVDVEGRRQYFLTDPGDIRRLARAGQVRGFDNIY